MKPRSQLVRAEAPLATGVPSGMTAESLAWSDIDHAFVTEWRDLAERASESNAFLRPEFVGPASTLHGPVDRLQVVTVRDEAKRLVGVGLFTRVSASRLFPLPHLRSFSTEHSFRSGLLLDRNCARQCVGSLLEHIADEGYFGVVFDDITERTLDIGKLHENAASLRLTKRSNVRTRRYAARSSSMADKLERAQSANRRKSIRRGRKRLAALGDWSFRVIAQGHELHAAAERFLELEHSCWKGEARSSLRSHFHDEEFFRNAVSRFGQQDSIAFSELVSNDAVIASAVTFIARDTGFAFKVGCDRRFAKVSPGVLLGLELPRLLFDTFPQLETIDSCSTADSILHELWQDSASIFSLIVSFRRRSHWALVAMDQGRSIKRWLESAT